jgi:hypothetical protein
MKACSFLYASVSEKERQERIVGRGSCFERFEVEERYFCEFQKTYISGISVGLCQNEATLIEVSKY